MLNIKPSDTLPVRNASRTRKNILQAAQLLFAEKGFTTTGVREVAAKAGVNSTLIRRYFGSKEGLLRAAIEDSLILEPFVAGGHAGFGERAVEVLKSGEELPSALAMMVLATADKEARSLCSDLMHEHITAPLADWLGGSNALARAAQINLLWIGYMSARQVLPLSALSAENIEYTRRWLAQTLQEIADQKD